MTSPGGACKPLLLVYLPPGIAAYNLLAVHALYAYDPACVTVVYDGDWGTLVSRYHKNPFVEAPWRDIPLPLTAIRAKKEARDGKFSGLLVQVPGPTHLDMPFLHTLQGLLPVTLLDVADHPGAWRKFLPDCYLKASFFADHKNPPFFKLAPYLCWGLLSGNYERPPASPGVDVFFVGSATTHPSRPGYLSELEKWGIAEKIKMAVHIVEPGQPHRLSKETYLKTLFNSKICLDLWGNAALTQRMFEGLFSGALVATQTPRWKPSPWTPRENEHFVSFDSSTQMVRVLDRLLEDYVTRDRIARAGTRWVRKTFAAHAIGEWLCVQTVKPI